MYSHLFCWETSAWRRLRDLLLHPIGGIFNHYVYELYLCDLSNKWCMGFQRHGSMCKHQMRGYGVGHSQKHAENTGC